MSCVSCINYVTFYENIRHIFQELMGEKKE